MLSTGHESFLVSLQIAFKSLLKSCMSFHSCYSWEKYFFKGIVSLLSLSSFHSPQNSTCSPSQKWYKAAQEDSSIRQHLMKVLWLGLFISYSRLILHGLQILVTGPNKQGSMQSLSNNQKWFMLVWKDIWLNNSLNPACSCQRYSTDTNITTIRHRIMY